MILGLVEDETNLYFSETESTTGMGPQTRDKYLRTLIRNLYNFHLNELFATVQNEYSDWRAPESQIRPKRLLWEASRALTDKLYVAPMVTTANWCNYSGFDTYFYVYGYAREVSKSCTIYALQDVVKAQYFFEY